MTPRVVGLLAIAVATSAPAQVDLDAFPAYQTTGGVDGSIKSVGSDTMNNVMTLWQEGFKRRYPNVLVAVEGKGSSTAPPALIAGTANFCPMSRAMKAAEIDRFRDRFGYEPTQLQTAIDMLAVYVHKDNPIAGLSLAQVDAIFSKERRSGLEPIRTWGDLGLTGEWADRPISCYGRNAASGTYGYFKKNVLVGGDFRDSVKEQSGSAAVVQAVGADPFAIGYSGIGYKTADVRAVALATGNGSGFVPAEPARAYAGEYPLARFLYVYINYKPNSRLDPLRREFVRYVFSREGQQAVREDGYLPVSPLLATRNLTHVGIEGP